MFIELIDALRCTNAHRDSWLVTAIIERDDRIIRVGTLGCPVCQREYPILDGVALFGVDPATGVVRHETHAAEPSGNDDAMLLGALLAVAEGATIAVTGRWASAAVALTGVLPVRAFIVNPDARRDDSERTGIIRSSEGIPLAAGSLRGVALDDGNVSERDVASALRALAPGARLVAPATTPQPPELAEIARDEQWWVAEKPRALVSLRRH
ncbi:MAG TPA: hypothetical protein VGT98_09975 [Candidatus Elarobacter sp.]|nr:hypothetical protein [Candidatus Elarobacter sp.]